MFKTALKLAAPVVVFFVGVALTAALVLTKPKESRSEVAATPTPVQVLAVEWVAHTARVPSTGLVEPAAQITVVPQVSGKVLRIAEGLAPGLRLRRGDLIAAIDSRDYAAAVEEAKAQVSAAALELELERRRGHAMEREFELLEQEPVDGVARREPHLANAEQRLRAAQAGLERAELNLGRTSMTAPFNAVVLSESVDVGQVVGGGMVATLAGTDRFLVRASVAVAELPLLGLPAPAIVLHDGVERPATALWSEGQLDPGAARLVVQVEEPLVGEVPLLLGSFVELQIEGITTDAVRVPRSAVQDGSVWLADEEDRLSRREVTVGWADGEWAYLTDGVEGGERVVLTHLSYPVEGMALAILADAP